MKTILFILSCIISGTAVAEIRASTTTVIHCESDDYENVLNLKIDKIHRTILFKLEQEGKTEQGRILGRINIQSDEQSLSISAHEMRLWVPNEKHLSLQYLGNSESIEFKYESLESEQNIQAGFKGFCTTVYSHSAGIPSDRVATVGTDIVVRSK